MESSLFHKSKTITKFKTLFKKRFSQKTYVQYNYNKISGSNSLAWGATFILLYQITYNKMIKTELLEERSLFL